MKFSQIKIGKIKTRFIYTSIVFFAFLAGGILSYFLVTHSLVKKGEIGVKNKEIVDVVESSNSAILSTEIPVPHVSQTPSPPVQNNLQTSSKWLFSKNQYTISVNNFTYTYEEQKPDAQTVYSGKVEFDLSLKNISIAPFITGFIFKECLVTKDGKLTRFTASGGHVFKKALPQGESINLREGIGIGGIDYDESGNKITSMTNLKIKSCKFYPRILGEQPTVGSQQLAPMGQRIEDLKVEPEEVSFEIN